MLASSDVLRAGVGAPAETLEVQAASFGHLTEGSAVLVVLIQPPAPADVLAHQHHQLAAVRVLANDGPRVPGIFADDPQDVVRRRQRRMLFAQAHGLGGNRSYTTAAA
jgi:hypothetical protein